MLQRRRLLKSCNLSLGWLGNSSRAAPTISAVRREAPWLLRWAGSVVLSGVLLFGYFSSTAVGASVTALQGYSSIPSTTEPYAVCPQPSPGQIECLSIIIPPAAAESRLSLGALSSRVFGEAGVSLQGGGEGGGLAPSDLRSAYLLPATGGAEQTVAIVDAFDDPNAESDLKVYRAHYGLAECTTANGCFKKVNELGEGKNYPAANMGWSKEISLDLDMVSAICPGCHILLVEASNNEKNSVGEYNLDIAENEAASLKATEISNSWGGEETSEETSEDRFFDHPGIPITVASGDYGYRVDYPAASKDVIAVGGTTLYKAPFYERGWFEEAWNYTGSGCSKYEEKPSWQTDAGCSRRTDNDVAAVAGVESPVSVYDSYDEAGWLLFGGTSVASPIIAGVEALSSGAIRSEGAAAFYRHPASLFDVSTGYNWADEAVDSVCSPEYLCAAGAGYDGPTGNGAPDFEDATMGSVGKWSAVPMPGPSSRSFAVSCTSSSFCLSVGLVGEYPAAQIWTGTEWSSSGAGFPRPSGGRYLNLTGVSCTSGTVCTAVGYYTASSGVQVTLAERWNGTEWKEQPTVNPTGAVSSGLRAVSCVSANACTAVGFYATSTSPQVTLAESWNGTTWKLQSTPDPTTVARLIGVSCTSATGCTAVGADTNGSGTQVALIERWNGTEWKEQPSPTGATAGILYRVSCTSPTACTAVGSESGHELPLAIRWNGTEWSQQKVPNPSGSEETVLEGVSCTSANSCEAVGIDLPHASELSVADGVFAEAWNGVEWTIQAMPAAPSVESNIPRNGEVGEGGGGISCVSSSSCVTVGNSEITQHFPYGDTRSGFSYSLSGTTWSLDLMPSTSVSEAVSCVSATSCTAVGATEGEGVGPAEIWNGGGWSSSSVALPAGAGRAALSGVSCGASVECAAVGSYSDSAGEQVALAEQLTKSMYGHESLWSVKALPDPAGAKASSLAGVSCKSTAMCVAVGSEVNSAGVTVTLSDSWSGSEWKEQAALNPTGAKSSELRGVSCVSATACTAVGQYTSASGVMLALVEIWNGSEWKEQAVSAPSGAKASGFKSVSCVSATMCTAVGQYTSSSGSVLALVEGSNGSEWKEQLAPNPAGARASSLEGVSCSSAVRCAAVGTYTNGSGVAVTSIDGWNGLEWTIQPSSNPVGASASDLRAVSCVGFPLCMATGSSTGASSLATNISETWQAGWSLQATPNPAGATASYMAGPSAGGTHVSCSSPIACVGVGFYVSASGGEGSLAERWNGSEWSIQTTPGPVGASESYLHGVSCASSSACTAVGYYEGGSGPWLTLAEHWNGTEWSIQPTPSVTGASGSELYDVSCVSATACVAVGWYVNGAGTNVTLAERWNGSEWSVQSTPDPAGAKGSWLYGTSCTSSTSCTAVGWSKNSTGTYVTLVEHWNGTEWSIQSTPNPAEATSSWLGAVSCSSSAGCTAVGDYKNGAGSKVALVERWNGTEWSIESAPVPSEATSELLSGVSCSSSTACTAVGWYKLGSGRYMTLSEEWSGAEWSVQPTPDSIGAEESELSGVSCSSSAACIAVGYEQEGAGLEVTLAELYR
jgi:hypothetical protein